MNLDREIDLSPWMYMDIHSYQLKRQALALSAPTFRTVCLCCRQPEFSCYCKSLRPFDPCMKFSILTHPIEAKRRIATGRMSHLCLSNSDLLVGQDYSQDSTVNHLLKNRNFQPFVLYPGINSVDLSALKPLERMGLFQPNKTPLVFVIDGTWATARKTMRLSQNLRQLPRLSFRPPSASNFRVRKQPRVDCLSTIEAIHHLIELLGSRKGFDINRGEHHILLEVFNQMVERQLKLIQVARHPRVSSYRRPLAPPV